MEPLIHLVSTHEDWLMHRLRKYAIETGYTRYTSTLVEAWRISIAGLSESLVSALREYGSVPRPGPDVDYTSEPAASFGIVEAQRHRARGVSLGMFLGMMKFYRQTYVDLVLQADFSSEQKELYRRYVVGFFDLVELGFCVEWAALSENEKIAELQSTNRTLTNEKNKYLTIFESLRDPALLFDRHNRLDGANHAANQLFLASGPPGSTYYGSGDRGSTPQWLADELADFTGGGESEVSFEKQLETRLGTRHFQVKLKRMLDFSEKFSGTVVILSEITARKWMENQLREDRSELAGQVKQRATELEKINRALLAEISERKRSEEALQRTTDSLAEAQRIAHLGNWDWDIEKTQLEWSDEIYRIFGLSPGEFGATYEAFLKSVHPDDREHVKSAVDRALREREPYSIDHRVVLPDGGERIVHEQAEVTYNDSGEPVRMIGTVHDITERKHAEAERAMLAKVIESSSEAIAVTDADGIVQYVNPAYECMTGCTRGEVVGARLPLADDLEIQEALSREETWSGPRVGRRKDGGEYHEECSLSTLRSPRGGVANYVVAKRDVTEKRRLESIAEAVNIMNNIGYIFSGIRHEIGNPINSTRMTLEMLKGNMHQLSADEIGDYLGRALEEVSKVVYLIRCLKSYNMFETPQMQTVEVKPFLDSFLGLVRGDTKQKGVEVESSIDARAVRCRADPRALQQVLLNVFTNALDACDGRPDPRISIDVSWAPGCVLFRVSDNGSGMSAAQRDELFMPFRTSKPHGTGLGMVIARRMLSRMNGTIEVNSQEGVGTSVDIRILEPGDEKP